MRYPQWIIDEIRKSGGVIQPGPGDVHVNRPLTQFSIAYMQSASAFVADRVFRNIPVMNQSDMYWEYDREAWLRSQMKERAPGTEAEIATYMRQTGSYLCRVWALKTLIDDQTRANTDPPLGPDQDATDFLSAQGLLQREKRFATNYLKDGVWNLSVDGAGQRSADVDLTADGKNNLIYWSSADSTPIEDIRLMKRSVQQRTGFRPNVLVISREICDILVDHPDIIDRLNRGQTDGPADANMDDLMRLFELEDILVMDAIEVTNALGATVTYEFLGKKDGLLLYRPARPGLKVPAAGYTFSWTGYLGAGDMGNRVKRYRMESHESDAVEIQAAYDFKQVSADMGVFLDGIVQ